ncbi:MAG TPA: GNAT family N-acetyltransferase [Candidatus Sulfotelmatobacter sp.]|nr:GNAT family N-acetyltransferase [Candidatus Sulfotelmatobacter sp.]
MESDRDPGPAISSAFSAPSAMRSVSIFSAETPAQIAQARELFLEYAQSLGFSLCFQNFDKELAELPGKYAPPEGRLLLANYQSQLAGCVAMRKLEPGICEMKRLYLRPQFRGQGLGRALAERIIAEARRTGYSRIRLDTVEPAMKDAVATYRKLGFTEIPPYCQNPIAGATYMELVL